MAVVDQSAAEREPTSETAVYVYGVTRAPCAQPRGAGVMDGAVDAIEHGGLAAIVGPVPTGAIRAKRRDLLRHTEVLQDVFATQTVIPLRFGTVFDGEAAVVGELLAPRHDELTALLRRFDGLGELRLRALYLEQAILAEIVRSDPPISRLSEAIRSSGGADPRRVQLGEAVARSLASRRMADADALLASLVPQARDVDVEEPVSEYEVLRASFLVEQGKVSTFDRRLDAVARDDEGRISFTYTGPIAPHAFVALATAPGA